jgi:ornithine cyclodeaminase
MPTYLGGRFRICGQKWYGSNVQNLEKGLPRSILTVMINDADTGAPIALMSGNLISAMRTGGVPGVGVRYLARQNAEVCTAIGCGPIQKASIKAIVAEAKSLKKIIAKALRPQSASNFIKWAKDELGIDGEVGEDLAESIRQGDIVSFAPSQKQPITLEYAWLKTGAFIILTSPASAVDDFWIKNRLIYDNAKMHAAYMEEAIRLGDVRKPANGWGSLYALVDQNRVPSLQAAASMGDVVADPSLQRRNENENIALVTSGQVVFDVAYAYDLYQEAAQRNIGQKLSLWDTPKWV